MKNTYHILPLLGAAILLAGCIPKTTIPAPASSPADTTAPTLVQVTAVPTPNNDTTPDYTFSSDEAGAITYGGDCSSITTSAVSGNNTVTFNTLAEGVHSNCTITVKDAANNSSSALAVTAFTIDTIAPTLAQVTAVATPTNDNTPNYTFSSTEVGTIIYGGDCSSSTTSSLAGNNTVTFIALADGVHSNCTITVTDAANNTSSVLAVTAFSVDATAPTLAQVTAVPYGKDTTPDYTFSSNEAGAITYGGDCSSVITTASSGNNTVTFAALGYGNHENCTITVTDAAGNASVALAIPRFAVAMKPYNDTGVTLCGDMAYSYTGYTGSGTHNNNVDCAAGASPSATKTQQGFEIANGLDAVPAGQDAVYGRDSNSATNSDSDGHKGFSFTKLKADGAALAIQNGTWSDSGSEAAGTKWSCVQDNVTGLIWEVKTNDGGLRDKDWTYSWYNSNNSTNGGSVGTADTGAGVGSDNCLNNARCDTEKYVADVNAATLCGASDWRMPTADELLTLAANDRITPSIDSNFISNTIGSNYVSASPSAGNNGKVWIVSFDGGNESPYGGKSGAYYVRLVRGGQ